MKKVLLAIFSLVVFLSGSANCQERDETIPEITHISGTIVLKKECYLRVEGKNFNPETLEVVVVGLYCESGCIIDHGAIVKFKGRITKELIEILPVTIDNPGKFKFIVRNNGATVAESLPYEVEAK